MRQELQQAWHRKQFTDTTAEIERQIEKGNLKVAEKRLVAAEKKFGDVATLRELRGLFEEKRREEGEKSWMPFLR